MDQGAQTHFRLGEVIVRPDRLEIEGGDEVRRVGPRAMEVLQCLAGRPDEVLGKAEILDAVWTGQYVGDDVLSTAIWELRRAFGDDARSPRFIQTVPRRGYRLLVVPAPVGAAAATEGVAREPVPADGGVVRSGSAGWPLGRWIGIGGAVLALVVAAAVALSPRPATVRSLVVLPIDALGDDDADQALADGVTDTLITALAGIDGLRVVSRTTAMTFTGSRKTVPEIGRELDVDLVVEGTLARDGGRVVLNAQLIEARSEDHLWARTYEREFEHLLDLQVEVARSIGGAIAHRLAPAPVTATPTALTAVSDRLLTWRVATGGEVWSEPVLFGGDLVVASRDGTLLGVGPDEGAVVWRQDLREPVSAALASLDGTLFAVSEDGLVVAIGPGGTERWRQRPGGSVTADPVVASGIVVVGDDAGTVHGLDPTSGRSLWTWGNAESTMALAAADEVVVVSRFDGRVTVLDSGTGRERWTAALSDWLISPAVVHGDRLLAPSPSGAVVALDLVDGREVWRSPVDAPVALAAWRDRVVVGSAGSGAVVALDLTTGAEDWRFEALDTVIATAVVDDLVLVASRDHNLYGLDAWTGERRFRVRNRAWVTTAPLVLPNQLVFGRLDGTVVSLQRPPRSAVPLVIDEEDGFVARLEAVDTRTRWWDLVRLQHGRAPARIRWRAEVGGSPLHAPAIVGGAVLSAGAGELFALDVADGGELWRTGLPGSAGTPPVVAGDLVVLGVRDGTVLAVDRATGVERWRAKTRADVISTPAVADGVLYAGSRDGYLYALRLADGGELWRRSLDVIHAAPAVVGEVVLVPSRNDTLWALDRGDGQIRWSAPTSDWAVADPRVAGGQVIVPSCDGVVEAFDLASGERRWRFDAGDEIWYRAALAGGRLFFGSRDRFVYALDAATGAELWRRGTDGWVLSSVAVWRDQVAVGSHDGRLWVLDAGSGAPVWQLQTTGAVGSPVVAGDLLAVGASDGFVYLVEMDASGRG